MSVHMSEAWLRYHLLGLLLGCILGFQEQKESQGKYAGQSYRQSQGLWDPPLTPPALRRQALWENLLFLLGAL